MRGCQWEGWRLYDGRWRGECGLGGVYAGSPFVLCDEVGGTFVGNDPEVVRSTGVKEVDGRSGPVK